MILSAFVTLALSAVSLVSASPLVPRAPSCRPNFEGVPVSVVDTIYGIEWGVGYNPGLGTTISNEYATTYVGEFHFAFNGAPTNTYNVRSLQVPQSPELIVSNVDPVYLTLQHENLGSPSDPIQSFIVLCDTCRTGASGFTGEYATGCTISPAGYPNKCYETGTVAPFLQTCDGGAAQRWNFFTSPGSPPP